jgi:cardiolipin synthase
MTAAARPTLPYDPDMDLALGRSTTETVPPDNSDAPEAPPAPYREKASPEKPAPCEGELGTSSGVNIQPGSDDDGWIVPPPVKLSDGTQVQLYKDGEALHAAYEAIKRAKRRVCLESYIFADDDTGRAFAKLLSDKARQGLAVYVIYDSVGSFSSDREMFRDMARNGVRVREFHPIRPWECKYSWRPANRDHRKLLVVDDDVAGLGGLNVGGEYAGSWVIQPSKPNCDLWRDNALGVRGPAASHFLAAFKKTWNYIGRGGRIRSAEYQHDLYGGEFGLLASTPAFNSPLRGFLCNLMSEAKLSIFITMAYFAPHDELIEELCKAANRGVHVRLMLPGRSDVHLLTLAQRSFYERLLSCGVEVYERQSVILHSKTGVIDGHCSVLGSTNIDYRSIEYNLELSAIVRNHSFGKQMQDLFENDVRYARRINLKEWRRRPLLDKLVQGAVIRARTLL